MKSYIVHYKNKYPGSRVEAGEDFLNVYCAGGEHRVALRRNGAGQIVDVSEEYGCLDRHDLAPIPKMSRVHKLHKDGKIGLDEDHVARREFVKGKVRVESEDELKQIEIEAKKAKKDLPPVA